ncbi:ladinin-1 [Syngnathus scovelli]|uniref:ladinin-1 n=1 Tax=Syngnathus scovelli TaxID=161590 RepID=UPI0021107023|nr:ladinin-1 [Syngnathus scovelli]
MSGSRRNWSNLSRLARQRTMEDEEEVERERRRRVKSSSFDDDDLSVAPVDTPASNQVFDTPPETSQGSSSEEQMQVDFMEILRVRDEKRRLRRTESLKRQDVVRKDDEEYGEGGGGSEEELSVEQPIAKMQQPQTVTACPPKKINSHKEKGDPSKKHSLSRQPSTPTSKFVSSVSISLNKSPSASGHTSPVSPLSPTTPRSPQGQWSSPCSSPSSRGPRSPIPNGHTPKTSAMNFSTNNNTEETGNPIFIRKSSRTMSYRMMKKKEEGSSPLQRSASVRVASQKIESNTVQIEHLNEEKSSSFQRNSAQRVSSRAIQEKMERLAQAAQKSETGRSPDVSQRTLYLLDEVSRKRDLFEKEPRETSPLSPSKSKHEFRGFTKAMSDRINHWLDKSKEIGSTPSGTDFKHVDISSKKS